MGTLHILPETGKAISYVGYGALQPAHVYPATSGNLTQTGATSYSSIATMSVNVHVPTLTTNSINIGNINDINTCLNIWKKHSPVPDIITINMDKLTQCFWDFSEFSSFVETLRHDLYFQLNSNSRYIMLQTCSHADYHSLNDRLGMDKAGTSIHIAGAWQKDKNKEIDLWVSVNCEDMWEGSIHGSSGKGLYKFREPEDAMMFRLRWISELDLIDPQTLENELGSIDTPF